MGQGQTWTSLLAAKMKQAPALVLILLSCYLHATPACAAMKGWELDQAFRAERCPLGKTLMWAQVCVQMGGEGGEGGWECKGGVAPGKRGVPRGVPTGGVFSETIYIKGHSCVQ